MSRIGTKPVQVPAGVTATVDGQKVTAKGPKGELFFVANDEEQEKQVILSLLLIILMNIVLRNNMTLGLN